MSTTSDILGIRGTVEYRATHCYGLWQRAKKRLEHERSAHRDELRRLDASRRQQLRELEQSLVERFQAELNHQLFALREEQDKQLQAYQQRVAELESELSVFRDLVAGKNHKEGLDFSGDGICREKKTRKKGGKKKGKRGGRRLHTELPMVDEHVHLEEPESKCPNCGLSYEPMGAFEDSEQIRWVYRLERVRVRSHKYVKSCQCPKSPSIITAPAPPQAMPHSKYDEVFWIEILVSKYGHQIPIQITCEQLAEHGLLHVNASTLNAGIERASELFEPFYQATIKHNEQAELNQADESSMPVFIDGSHKHYFYQYTSVDTVVYIHTEARRGAAIAAYLAEAGQTKLVCDRHRIYKCAEVELLRYVVICFCWVHVRRDFIKIGRYQRGHRVWARGYLQIIRRLFRINAKRRQALETDKADPFSRHDQTLRQELSALRERVDNELADDKLPEVRAKALNSLLRHWQGLTVFVDHPEVPMDNNRTERNWRDLARFRRNCNGVFSEKFAQITALLLSVFMTLKINNIALVPYLQVYFEACAKAGGRAPENLDGLLPWTLSDQIKARVQPSSIEAWDSS